MELRKKLKKNDDLVTRHSETINKTNMFQCIERNTENKSDKCKKWRQE